VNPCLVVEEWTGIEITKQKFEIWGIHGGADSSRSFLCCDAMQCCGRILTLRKTMLPPSSPWRWRQYNITCRHNPGELELKKRRGLIYTSLCNTYEITRIRRKICWGKHFDFYFSYEIITNFKPTKQGRDRTETNKKIKRKRILRMWPKFE